MPKIRFLPRDIEIEVSADTSVLEAAKRAGVPIATVCGGKASCTECRIRVTAGEEHMTPIVFKEIEHLGNIFYITKERLACQTFCTSGTLTVEVVKEQIESKSERARRKALARSKENAQRLTQRRADKAAREKSKLPAENPAYFRKEAGRIP